MCVVSLRLPNWGKHRWIYDTTAWLEETRPHYIGPSDPMSWPHTGLYEPCLSCVVPMQSLQQECI